MRARVDIPLQLVKQPQLRKPDWLKIHGWSTEKFTKIKHAVHSRGLFTVCEESHCPNIPECWSNEGTATFLLMGDVCTRGCKFCHVKTSNKGLSLDPEEPRKLAAAIAEMGLDYAVLTSVTRDDLPDQGASHFAECIKEIKRQSPETLVEVLTPDFQGNKDCIRIIAEAKPDVFAHNLETTKILQGKVRDRRANYEQSLSVLKMMKEINPKIFTKSSLILGLGETDEDVLQAFRDLRAVGVDIVTLGQYMRPSAIHLQVLEYVHPDKFEWYKQQALALGFKFVAAGPFVRSSYRAGELFIKHILHETRQS